MLYELFDNKLYSSANNTGDFPKMDISDMHNLNISEENGLEPEADTTKPKEVSKKEDGQEESSNSKSKKVSKKEDGQEESSNSKSKKVSKKQPLTEAALNQLNAWNDHSTGENLNLGGKSSNSTNDWRKWGNSNWGYRPTSEFDTNTQSSQEILKSCDHVKREDTGCDHKTIRHWATTIDYSDNICHNCRYPGSESSCWECQCLFHEKCIANPAVRPENINKGGVNLDNNESDNERDSTVKDKGKGKGKD